MVQKYLEKLGKIKHKFQQVRKFQANGMEFCEDMLICIYLCEVVMFSHKFWKVLFNCLVGKLKNNWRRSAEQELQQIGLRWSQIEQQAQEIRWKVLTM